MHPALFAALWVTAALPFSMLAYRWLLFKSTDEPKDTDLVAGATLIMLAIYLVVGFFWWSYVSAVYDANHPKVTQSRGGR